MDILNYDLHKGLTARVWHAVDRLLTNSKYILPASLPTDHDLGRTLPYYAQIHGLLAKWIGEFKSKKIAHLGSSTGLYLHYLNYLGAHTVAIDISDEICRIAMEVSNAADLQHFSVVCADARNLPLCDGALDAFVSDHFLFSSYVDLEEPGASAPISARTGHSSHILNRLSGVLKPRGIGVLANTQLTRAGQSEMLWVLMKERFELLELRNLQPPGPEPVHKYFAHLVIRKSEQAAPPLG